MAAAEAGGSPSAQAAGAGTPALRQYLAAKREHPDCVVLFRLGDFFEIFGEDAEQVAPILGLTLTGRRFGKGGRMPMCGVPHQSVEGYARKLLEAGLRVALCDQVEAPMPGAKVVARRVVRVLSAGTLVEESLLDPRRGLRCAALFPVPEGVGMAVLDFSTGECSLGLWAVGSDGHWLADSLSSLETVEVLLPADGEVPVPLPEGLAVSRRPLDRFDLAKGNELLGNARLGPPDGQPTALLEAAVRALAGAAAYGEEGQLALGNGLLRARWTVAGEVMELDPATRRNLELVNPLVTGGRTLLQLLDRTQTPPGARLLRGWLQAPLVDLRELAERQGAVAALAQDAQLRARLRKGLGGCRDLDRVLARCVHGVAGPRDLRQLAATLERAPEIAGLVAGAPSAPLRRLAEALSRSPLELARRLRQALLEDPPVLARDGGFLAPGFDPELDRIQNGSAAARQYLSSLEGRERARTGIRGLKVGYNRVFGYYIEVRGAPPEELPSDYIRRQTLVGAERYVTEELKQREAVVLSARDRAVARELEVLGELLGEVRAVAAAVARVASALAELDALQSLAESGSELGWVLPEIDGSRVLELREARHPLVEEALGPGRFVPNDTDMDGETERIALITGPNMAGKSTYLRQVALVCLLGQVGSLVPCRSARWGLVDRIFTRVGAQDDLSGGRSTFMVEMAEMASILDQATPHSLLVLDEIGRGTSTYDGMSIAQAILEYLHDTPGVAARVLFSTHYHQLTGLDRLPALRNYRAEVAEEGEGATARVTFLHSIVAGGADRSYGINVAQLAGLPPQVVARAGDILAELESEHPVAPPEIGGEQLALPMVPRHPVVEELRALRVDSMTPLEALQKIADWQRSAGGRG